MADSGQSGNDGRCASDLLTSYLLADVFSVKGYKSRTIRSAAERYVGGVEEESDFPGISGLDSGTNRLEAEGSVHGAGVDVEKSEALCEKGSDGSLAGSGGSIYGDNVVDLLHGTSQSFIKK